MVVVKGKCGRRLPLFLATLHVLFILLASAAPSFAASVILDWDPSTDADLSGYKVYYQADSAAIPFKGTGATQGSAPIDVANTTTATVDGLDPARSYFFAVTAYNSVGTESVYSNIIEIPEAVAPIVTISSPLASASVSGTVPVTASASDNVGVAKVEFYINGALKAAVTAAPYVYSWNTSALPPGSYTLSAKAYDAAGNVGQSAGVAVKVAGDVVPPTVSVTSPTANTAVTGSVTVSASATDNVGVTKTEVYDNGTLAFVSNQSSVSYAWDTTRAASGTHALVAKAYDAAGNVGQSSTVVVTVGTDATPPAVALTSPLAGSTVRGAVSVSANATDAVGVTRVEFYVQGAIAATTTTAPYSFTWNTASVANGSYTLTAKAYDAAGNIGRSGTVTVTVSNDKTAPSVSLTSPVAGTKVGGTVAVTAAATDNVGVGKVSFFVNGVLKSTDTTAPYSYSWTTTAFANGSYTLTAKAYDAAGNVGQSGSVTVTVYNDKTAPTVTLLSPTSSYFKGTSLAVKASGTDNVGIKKMLLYIDGVLKYTTTYSSFSTSVALAAGQHTIVVKAYDAANNVGTVTKTVTLY
ncbi:Ig-like domain-containing protein [Geomonas sp. RF6]|uniref:Ig-like domain-containing protein n=1 Tax=Geomonas sp. RF6 TaxID=2897342 RepID=UPI001E329525|nr:Ig-like domain-containing protein [Geomonas sp. RF6]UFS69117.1 Ig-like domain-containing protein [Geomonas sp. RF6]